MAVLKGEIKVVVSVLNEADAAVDTDEPWELDTIAQRIVEDLDEHRAKKPMFSIVARVSADHGTTWKFFVYGPFKSRAIANQKSGGLFPPGSPLYVKWLILENVSDFRKQVLAVFKDEESSAWGEGEVPVELLRSTEWIEPLSPEEE
jgi:hypothetical protein